MSILLSLTPFAVFFALSASSLPWPASPAPS